MDSNDGAWAVQALRAAKGWGKPPLTLLADRPDHWRPEDTVLAVAFDEFESGRLDSAGLPKRLSESEDHEDAWDVDADTINYARKRMDEWRKANPEPPLGVVPKVVYAPTIRPDER